MIRFDVEIAQAKLYHINGVVMPHSKKTTSEFKNKSTRIKLT